MTPIPVPWKVAYNRILRRSGHKEASLVDPNQGMPPMNPLEVSNTLAYYLGWGGTFYPENTPALHDWLLNLVNLAISQPCVIGGFKMTVLKHPPEELVDLRPSQTPPIYLEVAALESSVCFIL